MRLLGTPQYTLCVMFCICKNMIPGNPLVPGALDISTYSVIWLIEYLSML
jgi:hypothetical protein